MKKFTRQLVVWMGVSACALSGVAQEILPRPGGLRPRAPAPAEQQGAPAADESKAEKKEESPAEPQPRQRTRYYGPPVPLHKAPFEAPATATDPRIQKLEQNASAVSAADRLQEAIPREQFLRPPERPTISDEEMKKKIQEERNWLTASTLFAGSEITDPSDVLYDIFSEKRLESAETTSTPMAVPNLDRMASEIFNTPMADVVQREIAEREVSDNVDPQGQLDRQREQRLEDEKVESAREARLMELARERGTLNTQSLASTEPAVANQPTSYGNFTRPTGVVDGASLGNANASAFGGSSFAASDPSAGRQSSGLRPTAASMATQQAQTASLERTRVLMSEMSSGMVPLPTFADATAPSSPPIGLPQPASPTRGFSAFAQEAPPPPTEASLGLGRNFSPNVSEFNASPVSPGLGTSFQSGPSTVRTQPAFLPNAQPGAQDAPVRSFLQSDVPGLRLSGNRPSPAPTGSNALDRPGTQPSSAIRSLLDPGSEPGGNFGPRF